MHTSSLLRFVGVTALAGSLEACFIGDDDARSSTPPPSHPSSSAPSCGESRPEILALDMNPSATIGPAGDYELEGTIVVSCSAVFIDAHVLSPEGHVRFTAAPGNKASMSISLRFAASQKGTTPSYEISVFDTRGNQSWPPLRQSVSLE
jgi:hypothetical protein